MFISFEGIDGCGKSTQIIEVARYIQQEMQQEIVLTREPGGTEIAEKIRDFALQTPMESPLAEALLMNAARHLHVQNVINPAIKKGDWVLSDRFCHSTFAYQAEVGLEKLYKLHDVASYNLYPDLTFMIDILPEKAIARRAQQQQTHDDLFEQRNLQFKQNLREKFLKMAENNKAYHIIDGEQAVAKVTEDIITIIRKKYEEELK